MNLLASLLPLSNVELDIDARDKGAALERAAQLFENNQGLSGSRIVECLTAREQLGSTGLGKGVAIPHGRLARVEAGGRGDHPGEGADRVDSPDGQPVWLLVVLLVPEHATQQHLEILSELAQMLSEPRCGGSCRRSRSRAALLATVAAWSRFAPRPDMLTFESLFEDNGTALDLRWIGEPTAGQRVLPDASGSSVQAAELVGHLNLIHPKRIHVLGGARSITSAASRRDGANR